ncbi:MAG: AMP-binding protein [Candidatus Methylomirabilis oxyfera]|nr:AMP-binding protein [Candidatus Methylomirabilis oxyfera]
MSMVWANTVPLLFQNQVARYGNRVALRKKGLGRWKEISWREYGQRVREVAAGLVALGLRRGECVSIIAENRPEWLYSDLGIMAAGGVTVGIYTTSSPEQCAYILSHSEARFHIVEDEEQLDKVLRVRDRLPLLERIIVIDLKGLRKFQDPMVISFEQLLSGGREYDAARPSWFRQSLEEGKPEDVAIFVYTSGTTGPPKGAMLSHETILFSTTLLERIGSIRETDETISYLPLAHIAQRLLSTFGQIRYGYIVNFAESLDTFPYDLREVSPQIFFGPPRIWEKFYSAITLRMEKATWLKRRVYRAAVAIGNRAAKRRLRGEAVPSSLRLADLLARLAIFWKLKQHLGLDRARYVLSGAAPISPGLLEFFQSIGIPIKESYGQTENCGPATAHLGDRIKLGTVGQAIPGCEVKIAEDGEILLRGRNVFQGYFKDPQATIEALRDGWLYTGDVGELDSEQFLTLTDRKKDLIITAGGKNIAPQPIENQLKASPYVADAVVIGDRRKYLTALIVIDEETVANFAQEQRIPFTTFSDLSRKREVYTLISDEVDLVNNTLSQAEKIKKFSVLDKKLDPEDGDVTPTMKVKRKAISERHRDLIESMYE